MKALVMFGLIASSFSSAMERPPKAHRIIEEETHSYPPSPMPQERESYPISPSSSEANMLISGKRKQPAPVRAIKRTRPSESYSIGYHLKHNPQLIRSRLQGNTLDLSGLSISSLDGLLAIPGINVIFNISLAHNLITHVERKDFTGLSQLITLDLSNNDIELLETDGFADLSSLTNLFLNNNRIRFIEDDSFTGLNNLKKLSLAHNRINAMHQKMLFGLHHLEELHLNDNAITDIEKYAFSDLSFLKRLKLNKNKLAKLTGPMFEGTKYRREQLGGRDRLNALQELDLRDNKLTEIPTTILIYLPALGRLLLSNNQIANVNAQNITALKKASNLKLIDLVNNKLTDAELKKLKIALPSVEIIATVAMETTEVVEGLLGGFSAAKGLSDLEQNLQLQQEAQKELAASELVKLHNSLKDYLDDEDFMWKLFLQGGPYQYWYWLKHLGLTSLEGLRELPDVNSVFRIYLDNNQLRTIPANAFAGLTKLREIELTSNQIETFDPQAFANVPQLKDVSLSSNRLRTLNPALMPQFKNLERLSLEENGIQSLPPFIFKDLKKLTGLYLGHNKLKEITTDSLIGLENLTSLDLNSNMITYLNPEILKPFKKLKFLNIAGNPLSKENVEAIKKALPKALVLF